MATQTLTLLFADIDGSTVMLQRLGDAYAVALADHHRLMRTGLTAQGGGEVVTPGDEVVAVFAAPRACVDTAIQVQRGLVSHAWSAGRGCGCGWASIAV